ncbi:phospholipase DDHD2 [Platysternon megacephalum]|uniref:Phospholipase DDHD2 n=1 Tax=Platysternon megacephalum TaxID=55544 RepID=A0A4D9EFT0_9SAUR|nr:phospholipase DDHD2 [Platysternon megacephalum]
MPLMLRVHRAGKQLTSASYCSFTRVAYQGWDGDRNWPMHIVASYLAHAHCSKSLGKHKELVTHCSNSHAWNLQDVLQCTLTFLENNEKGIQSHIAKVNGTKTVLYTELLTG